MNINKYSDYKYNVTHEVAFHHEALYIIDGCVLGEYLFSSTEDVYLLQTTDFSFLCGQEFEPTSNISYEYTDEIEEVKSDW